LQLSTDKACNPINFTEQRNYAPTNSFLRLTFTVEWTGRRYSTSSDMVMCWEAGALLCRFFKERAKKGVLPITDPRMTRYWITLDQAVHLVIQILKLTCTGAIFVPKIPSMKITDLATAIAPECTHEIVGIRPGEKIHETLIGEDEGRKAVEYRDCYVIWYNHPDMVGNLFGNGGKPCPEGFKYTSDNNSDWLDVDEIGELLEKISDDYSIEKTRWSLDDVPQ